MLCLRVSGARCVGGAGLFDSTELLKLAGADDFCRVRLKRSWVRPCALVCIDLMWAVLVAAVVRSPGFLPTISGANFVAGSFIGIVALLCVVLFVSYFLRTRYDLTTEAVEVDPGGKMCRRVGLEDVGVVERYGWFVRVASGGRVSHLKLGLKSGGVVRLKDLLGAELVEHAIMVRRGRLAGEGTAAGGT